MDIHMPDLDGIQATWLVSSRAPHGAVIMVTSEERIDFVQKAMSAGAQGYVLKPFGSGTELFQTIRDVHGRSSARRMQASGGAPLDARLRPRIGKRIVVLSVKGGVGATTIAVSLALLLCERPQHSVVLFDADFLAGDTTLQLDLKAERSVLDLIPPNPEQAEALTADMVRTVLSSLAQMYDEVARLCTSQPAALSSPRRSIRAVRSSSTSRSRRSGALAHARRPGTSAGRLTLSGG
jgi:hypothetical protein